MAVCFGCLLRKTSVQGIPNNTPTTITWQTAVYNTDPPLWTSSQSTRIVIPSGVSLVRLTAQGCWDPNTTGYRAIAIFKNGDYNFWGYCEDVRSASVAGGASAQLVSPVLQVSTGDYFELRVNHTAGTTLNFPATDFLIGAWFMCEILG